MACGRPRPGTSVSPHIWILELETKVHEVFTITEKVPNQPVPNCYDLYIRWRTNLASLHTLGVSPSKDFFSMIEKTWTFVSSSTEYWSGYFLPSASRLLGDKHADKTPDKTIILPPPHCPHQLGAGLENICWNWCELLPSNQASCLDWEIEQNLRQKIELSRHGQIDFIWPIYFGRRHERKFFL